MAFKVEEALKSSALSPPPEENDILTKGFALPEYSNGFATSLSRSLSSPMWRGMTTLEDAQKALESRYQGFAAVQQTVETFKPSPIAEMLAESFIKRHRETVDRVFEAWRPKINGFVGFAESVASAAARAMQALEELGKRPPFMFAALDAWESFLDGDLEAIDRFIVDRLHRDADDKLRVYVQRRLKQAFGTQDVELPRWADDPVAFDVAVSRSVRADIRREEEQILKEVARLQEAIGTRVSWDRNVRLRGALAGALGLDAKNDKTIPILKRHYREQEFPGAVLIARYERPELPELPRRQGEDNLRSYTARIVARDGREGLLKKTVLDRPLLDDGDDHRVDYDPVEDGKKPRKVVAPTSEIGFVERFAALEAERRRMREVIERAGLSAQQEQILDLKLMDLSDMEISARIGRSRGHVASVWSNVLVKVTRAAGG